MLSILVWQKNNAILFFVIALLLLAVSGCSTVRQSIATLRTTDYFIAAQNDSRVLFEPGAEAYAEKIVALLPEAIQQIEARHYRQFPKPVKIYVCGSQESFRKLYGKDVRGGVLLKLFLSPLIFEGSDHIVSLYLMHELSHLLILQQIGPHKRNRLPFWFKEGLATYASDGGGAHSVTEMQAIHSIQSGKFFVPNESGGLIFRNTPSDWGLQPHMFYRQSMMFVTYIKSVDEAKFTLFLLSVQNGQKFSKALKQVYGKSLADLWNQYLQEIQDQG